MNKNKIIIFTALFSMLLGAKIDEYDGVGREFSAGPAPGVSDRGIGQYGYQNDPMSDRAQGFL
jgi:hypothetical protein